MADGNDFQFFSGTQKYETASENACILYVFHSLRIRIKIQKLLYFTIVLVPNTAELIIYQYLAYFKVLRNQILNMISDDGLLKVSLMLV